MKLLFVSFLFLGLFLSCHAAEDYDQHVKNLAEGTPDKEIKASLLALAAANTAAFPTLIAHFGDGNPAAPRYFQRDESEIAPDGSSRIHRPTMGEVCFDILQGQIEGNWPKAFRGYYILKPDNAQQWLDAHRGLTIQELHREALQESLHRAQAETSPKTLPLSS